MAIRINQGLAAGLIISPQLGSDRVSSVTMTFEPSIGIIAAKVDKLGLDIRSFREPLKRSIQKVIIPSIQQNFIQQGYHDPESGQFKRWQSLDPETLRNRMYGGGSKPHIAGLKAILIATGTLKKTMNQFNIWHVEKDKALLANLPSKVWYGALHQTGYGTTPATFFDPIANQTVSYQAETGATWAPARPFVVLGPQDEDKIADTFAEWLGERINRDGLGPARPLGGGLL